MINLSNGFLPSKDPILHLSHSYAVWEELGKTLPKLLVSDQLRKTINEMPVLSTDQLQTEEDYERAMLLLSFFGHAYVWGSEDPATRLPASIARPWYEVSKKLSRPPVLSYASYALHNWQKIKSQRSIELGNIALLQNFLGGVDEEWFVLVHVEIEKKAGVALQSLLPASHVAKKNEVDALTDYLDIIANALVEMCNTLDRMPEHCDPYIYYRRVRPYIHGWKDNPALPDGIIYEGVEAFQGKPQKFRGETGAQSSIIPSLDAAFGIEHHDDPLKVYLLEMRDYMPIAHRQFMEDVKKNASIRQCVAQHSTDYPLLRDNYNACVNLIARFRHTHLTYAAQYIQKQSQTSIANPTETGTGGTPFMTYLRKHKEETEKYLI